jgi:aspartyl-tRNA(Asn)/glutamyl-tRNA(Gln) amidotransferase subunit A
VHDDVAYLTATELLGRFARRDLSPVEVVRALLERIAAFDPGLRAITTADADGALESARAAERRHAEGRPLALDGVPVLVKDIFDTAGLRTTYGSAMFADHVPAADAAAVERLRAAGAVVLGKSTTHEFAWGITSASEPFGPVRNPWAPDRVPGGSSGGSGAALAAGFAPLALGTDTAGSIRIPAAFCGVLGLKATYAAVDARGVFPLAPSLDHVGPMARTAQDAALLHGVLTGEPLAPASERLDGLRVGVCPDLDQVPLGEDAERARGEAARALEGLGATVAEVRAPDLPKVYATLGVTLFPEASHVHRSAGLWPDRREEYGPDVTDRLELAAAVTLDQYLVAAEKRRTLTRALRACLSEVDVLLTPVSAVQPITVAEAADDAGAGNAFREHVITSTAPQSLSGLPALVVRAAFGDDGLPVGVQLTGPLGGEALLLRTGGALQGATAELQARRPELTR